MNNKGLLRLEFSEYISVPNVTSEFLNNLKSSLNITFYPTQDLKDKQSFEWKIVSVKPSYIEVQVNFSNPHFISASDGKDDEFQITFTDTTWIRSLKNNGLNRMQQNYTIDDFEVP